MKANRRSKKLRTALDRYFIAQAKHDAATEASEDANGRIDYAPSGLKGAETKAFNQLAGIFEAENPSAKLGALAAMIRKAQA